MFDRETADFLGAHEAESLAQREAIEFESTLGLGPRDRTYHQIKFPIYDGSGQPYAVCTIATDITQRKLAEREYQALLSREQSARREAKDLPALRLDVRLDGRHPRPAVESLSLQHHDRLAGPQSLAILPANEDALGMARLSP